MSWQNHPLSRLVIPFTLGMIGASLFIDYMNTAVLFILCCAVLGLSFFLLKTSSAYKDGTFGIVAISLFFLIGMTLYTGKHRRIEQGVPTNTTLCQGTLIEPPSEKKHSWTLELKQADGTHILLYAGKDKHGGTSDSITFGSIHPGDTIVARIFHINATNHCTNDTFKTYNTYLFHRDICATAYTPPRQWSTSPCRSWNTLSNSAKTLQEQLHQIYDDRGLHGEAGSIVEAMTIGRKTNLTKETRQTFSKAGISHILALSGFHVGIIVMMIQAFFLKTILSLRWQLVSNILIIATLWGYALLTGLSPSLVRATTMFSIILLCQSIHRDAISLNSCALAFFIMLCINPFYLHDIGFQMSFIAVGAIGLLGNRLVNLYRSSNNTINHMWLISIIAISLISTIFTAPLVAHYFGRAALISPISNLVLFGFVYLLMWTSILWWGFLWCEPINSLLTYLLKWTATAMTSITEWLASLPFASIEWHPSTIITALCYVVLLALTYFITNKQKSI